MNPPSHPLEAPHPLHPSIPLSAFQCDEIEEGNGPGSPKRDRKGQTNDCDEIKIDVEPVGRVKAAQAPREWWCSKTTMGWLSLALTVVVIGALVTYFSIFYDDSTKPKGSCHGLPLPTVKITNGPGKLKLYVTPDGNDLICSIEYPPNVPAKATVQYLLKDWGYGKIGGTTTHRPTESYGIPMHVIPKRNRNRVMSCEVTIKYRGDNCKQIYRVELKSNRIFIPR
eukprot:52170_1